MGISATSRRERTRAASAHVHAKASPTRAYHVRTVSSVTPPDSTAGSPRGARRTTPRGSTIAVTPEFVARTTQRRVSTARTSVA
jgi:hypothetical protein